MHVLVQVTKVVWDATNAVLAISCLDETCQLWQRTRAGWRRLAVLKSKSGRFTCMCFLPGGEQLITGAPFCPVVHSSPLFLSAEQGLEQEQSVAILCSWSPREVTWVTL